MSLVRFASLKWLQDTIRVKGTHAYFGPAAGWSHLYSDEKYSTIMTYHEVKASSRAGTILQLLKVVAEGPKGMAFLAAVRAFDEVDGITDPTWRLRFGLIAMREAMLPPMYDRSFLPVPRYVDPALAGDSSVDLAWLLAADDLMTS